MRARDAKTFEQICALQRDNLSSKHGWITISEKTVTIAQHKAGEPATAIAELPRSEFNRLIDWYNRPQRVRK